VRSMKKIYLQILVVTVIFTLVSGFQAFAKIKLRVASGQDVTEIEIRRQIAELYAKKNPDVEIEMVYLAGSRFDKQQTMITAGNAPDILYINQPFLAVWATKGALMDLTPFIQKDGGIKKVFAGIHPKAIECVTYKGKIWAMPFEFGPMAIVYNKDLFRKAGVPVPPTSWEDPKWTWEEFINRAKKLTKDTNGDGRPDQFGINMDLWDCFRTWLRQAGTDVLNKEGSECLISPDNPNAVEAFQFMYDTMYKYKVAPTPIMTSDTPTFSQFMTGKLAMFNYGRWLNTFKSIKDFKWDVGAFPHQKRSAGFMPVLHYGISTQCKNPEIAWDFLKFLITKEPQVVNSRSGMAVPVLQAAVKPGLLEAKVVENEQVWWHAIQYEAPEENHPKYFEYDNVILRELGNLWLDKATVTQTLKNIEEGVTKILKSE